LLWHKAIGDYTKYKSALAFLGLLHAERALTSRVTSVLILRIITVQAAE